MRNISIQKPLCFINSLAKGLSVLGAFGEAGHPLTLSEIAHASRANNTTATRLCHTLIELGFIQKDGQRRYHLTPKVLTLRCHMEKTLAPSVIRTASEISEALIKMEVPLVMDSSY